MLGVALKMARSLARPSLAAFACVVAGQIAAPSLCTKSRSSVPSSARAQDASLLLINEIALKGAVVQALFDCLADETYDGEVAKMLESFLNQKATVNVFAIIAALPELRNFEKEFYNKGVEVARLAILITCAQNLVDYYEQMNGPIVATAWRAAATRDCEMVAQAVYVSSK